MNSIVEYVSHYAEKTPSNLCIADLKGVFDYHETWDKIRKCANFIKKVAGIKQGELVLVECTQDRTFLVVNMACELIGAIFVPFFHKAKQESVQELINETGSCFLISETEYLFEDSITNISIKEIEQIIYADDDVNISDHDFCMPQKSDIAEILFTTGTTGKSKGIEITHEANAALAENISFGVEIERGNIELVPLPLNHSHGLRTCYADLYSGSGIVIADGVTQIADLLQLVQKYNVTSMDLSPSAVLIMEKLSRGRMSDFREQIRYIQIGTAELKQREKEYLKSTFPDARLYNSYGATESGRTCVIDFNHTDKPDNCIGKCTKNAFVKVVNEDGKEIIDSSPEKMGRLAFRGKMNMRGYFRQPELTKEVLVDGYLYTSDIGYVDEAGYIFLFGRAGDVINYGGIKISPNEVENAALRTQLLQECACVPVEDAINGQSPKLYIVPEDSSSFSLNLFKEKLGNFLEKEKMPRFIEIIDKLPKTENGKILKRELIKSHSAE